MLRRSLGLTSNLDPGNRSPLNTSWGRRRDKVWQNMTESQASGLGWVGTGEASCRLHSFSVFRLQCTVRFRAAEIVKGHANTAASRWSRLLIFENVHKIVTPNTRCSNLLVAAYAGYAGLFCSYILRVGLERRDPAKNSARQCTLTSSALLAALALPIFRL